MKRLLLPTAALLALGCVADNPVQPATPAALSAAAVAAAPIVDEYLIGTGFICGLAPEACPVVTMAPNGDRVELTGHGTFATHPKSVTGDGTFTHKDASGTVLGSGTWTATQLVSFHSYGVVEGGLEGGIAIIRVHLSPGFDGLMRVDCQVGKPPPGSAEGVTLAINGVIDFNKKVSGFTLFIRS